MHYVGRGGLCRYLSSVISEQATVRYPILFYSVYSMYNGGRLINDQWQ